MIIDLGTGDGRAVLAAAAREPRSFALGVDANAASMAESSRRAARPTAKGGLPNAVFVVSSIEALPAGLDGSAHEVTVLFPWGSLLRGALGLDEAVADAIARLVRPDGRLRMMLSVTERDGIPDVPHLDEAAVADVARRHATRCLTLVVARQATPADLAVTRSSWARRLSSGSGRVAWILDFMRRADVRSSPAGA